jgi:SAM-dependent methyltransferase
VTRRLLDELALAGPEHLEPEYVAAYERKAQFDPTGDLEELRSRGLGAASTLIDFGAGTGTFALAAASVCRHVLAVDVSPAMVAEIEAKSAREHVPNVEGVQAGFLSYEHRGPPVDFVYTRNALHHLPDFWKGIALSRIADVLVPGGVLLLRDLVFSFDLAEAEERIAAWLDSAAAERPEDGWTRDELERHVREEYSTFTWLLEPLLKQAGFAIEAAEYAPSGIHAAYVCVKRGGG